ncbi:MAG TPA: CYTH domain-containing protein [Gammaproteobacteria bacterium]|nr:CYTH domain-containing protein [Gammaproteobacteria bacterium]
MIEQEYKLRVTQPEQYEAVAGAPEVRDLAEGAGRTLHMIADYIDTAELSLLRAGYAYRVRKEGEQWVAAIKADMGNAAEGGLHHHREWEAEVDTPEPDLGVFGDPDLIEALLALQGDRPLVTLFRVDMERRVLDLRFDGDNRAEWAADRGRIIAGDKVEPLCEVELELKGGSMEPVRKLAETLRARYPLAPDQRTKFARGLALAGLEGNSGHEGS